MSVSVEFQRRGIGGIILQALLAHAASNRYKEVVLETTASWVSAVAFYKRHGFRTTVTQNGDQHFRLVLDESGAQ
jgi:ribosomal protein S18 acetylase RimI-like enzyme